MNQDQLLEIGIKKREGQITDSWQDVALNRTGGIFKDGETFRLWVKDRLRKKRVEADKLVKPDNYKESVDINSDGSISSNRLVKMSFEDSKDPAFLLKAHGYDIDAWELISARSNIWNAYSKQDGIMQLYSSKITVKRK